MSMIVDPDVLLPPAPPKRRLWRTRAVVIATVVGTLIGFGAGAATQPEPNTVTTTETVEIAPQSCLDALDLADRGFTYGADAMQGAADGFDAVSRFDVAGVEAATAKIEAAGADLESITPDYQAAKADCRSSG